MQSISITSVSQAADAWDMQSYPQNVVKNAIFKFFSIKEDFQKEELTVIEDLKIK